MSSDIQSTTGLSKGKFLPISRKIVQILSFFILNYAILEFIFQADFSLLSNYLKVLPFLHSAENAWTAGIGLLEYTFYAMARGEIPWLFFGMIGLFGLFTNRIFCGWICPTGLIQDLFAGIGDEHKKMPIDTDRSLKKWKIGILIVWVVMIAPLGILLVTNPDEYDNYASALGAMVADPIWTISLSDFLFVNLPNTIRLIIDNGNLANLFNEENRVRTIVLFFYIIVMVLSSIWPRFYCRYFCPYGGAISLFSRFSLLKLQRLPTRCPGRKECGVCEKVCTMQIRILDEPNEGFTGKGECTLCLDCMAKCPHDAIKWKFGM